MCICNRREREREKWSPDVFFFLFSDISLAFQNEHHHTLMLWSMLPLIWPKTLAMPVNQMKCESFWLDRLAAIKSRGAARSPSHNKGSLPMLMNRVICIGSCLSIICIRDEIIIPFVNALSLGLAHGFSLCHVFKRQRLDTR